MSELKTNKVSPATGTGLQLGDSGDTVTVPTGATLTVTDGIAATSIADGSVTNAEFQYINTLSSNAQTQIDAKSPTAGNASLVTTGTISSGVWNGTAVADGYVASASTWNTATTTANAALPKAGGTMSGTITCADETITGPMLKDYSETKVAMAAHSVDLSLGNVQTYTLSGTQTLTFDNPIGTGNSSSFTLIVTNGGSATLNWPGSVDWAGAASPTLTSSGVDVLTFTTIDGGTTWYGFAAGLAMA